jgi:subfamily B ATP-binding cassette protein MsbA
MSQAAAKASTVAVYRRLLRSSSQFWPVFAGAAFAMIVYAACDTGFAYLIKLLTSVVSAGEDTTPREQFIARWLPAGVLVLFVVRGVSQFLSTYSMAWIARQTIKRLRGQVFEKYLCLPTSFFDRSATGDLLSRLTFNVEQIAEAASSVLLVLIRDTLTIIGLVIFMVFQSPTLSLVILLLVPPITLLIRFLSGLFRQHSLRIQSSMGSVTRIADEALQGHKVIKIFNGQDYEARRFGTANEMNRRMNMRLITTKSGGDAVTVFLTAIGVAGVVFFVNQISIQTDQVNGFLAAMLLLMAPMKRLTNLNVGVQRGMAAGESIFEILDYDSELDTGLVSPANIKGTVEYRDVNFTYAADKGSVLRDINLSVPAGQSLAIVGRSGSGKSTLVGLLPRFYAPDSGQILIDDVPIQDYSLQGLRQQISLVSQEVTLFNDTIANNIAYGSLSEVSAGRLEQAVQAAHVDEFLRDLPDGLKTTVGDRGVLLSGGQRQRISIARALLKDAPILILDEATSALDTESERHIQAALQNLMTSRTTFVIAHRLSTVENVDRILVIDNGRIIETGTHADLLAAGGHYAALYRLQFRDDAA